MRGVATIIGAFGLVGLVIALGAVLLPACGALQRIAPSWVDWCPANRQASVETRLADLDAARVVLEQRILERERALALFQCEAQIEAPLAALPEAPEPPPIDRDAWDSRDVALLEGCWDLDSRFTTRDRSGRASVYQVWQMCFDGTGRGREEMRSDSGSVCGGPVTGTFESDGRLLIREPGNLQCSDGGFIYRLESRCSLREDGTAECDVRQPETDASTKVNFRRSARSQ